ncbi:methyl-accepting chemotaxis protein [Devosia sp. RR2S18]|uniref:methyl-accepting chemotaxis protein n=1 Tax=Devosia rhizosphaerae TaxID=3049774 RepID=UPI00253F7A77|nr:methyl-accepting chemotaxis protein [Devosia sp. RR2S18]WIJ25576.1 methyl-accepting chemotaxis protein [Devosia sp. RR2S18]
MFKRVGQAAGNIKMTTKIAALVISAVILSVAVVVATIFFTFLGATRDQALEQQAVNLKTAATILQGSLAAAEVAWTEDGDIDSISTWAMPRRFINHDMVDSIARVTGQAATIFGWDETLQDFVRMSTTIVGEDGERILDTTLGQDSTAYAPLMAGETYQGESVIVGRPYYTAYEPILDQGGKTLGVLFVGTDKQQAEAVVYQIVQLLLMVGAAVVAVLAVLGYFASRQMMKAIPKLAQTMRVVADGDYEAEVPFSGRGDEIGDMARAVEVFRANGLKVSEMTEEERAASIQRRAERTDMMVALQAAFGEVVDAAIAGDFSKRVHAEFPDQELNALAGSVNSLVETVDRGINETGEVLDALANTDLTKRMHGDYQGAFAKLKEDTNRVADKLTDVVRQLRDTSRTLKTATGEILSGANDLSERTTKQAATIEETSAAMEQLAGTVAENARMAESASGNAQTVSQKAAQSGETMSQANVAMERITQSSAKISNIIGMIDDIAFQTNLLALNASVEAARAGDAGKGFAVVAVEVRRLAQSAASASSDVKALIEQSANEVTGGSKLVSNAAEQLSAMLNAVEENATLMVSIAKASREQAAAIDEVTVAVRTLDEMTQHNAALVEETNAAIEQTEGQANELDRVVAVFTTGDEAAAGRTSAPVRAQPNRVAAGAKALQDKLGSLTKKTYLSHGNAAVDTDWSEF